MKKFSLDEICNYLEADQTTKEEQEKFSPQGLKCPLVGARGAGGFALRMLLIPESIQVIVSMPACGRHGDLDVMAAGITNRFFRIRLTEKDIVSGASVKKVSEEVLNLVETMENRPKVLTLCITCIDALLHTDYAMLGKKLKEQYGMRFEVTRMFPFLAESVKTHFDLLMESVYGLIEVAEERKNRKVVNIIGKTDAASPDTDFYKVLQKAGYEVQEIHACKTLDDYDKLGEACLNVVLNKHTIPAAKMMEKKHGIPYVEFLECLNPEIIRQNYEQLGNALGCKLDFEEYYLQACEKVNSMRELLRGKSFASGAGIDYNPVKLACEWCQMGFPLKYFLVSQIKKEDMEYYRRLKENSPETYVYLVSDTSMMQFINAPDNVAYGVGVQYGLLQKMDQVSMLKMSEEPYDFMTLIQAMEQIEASLSPIEMKAGVAEPDIFARNWSTYKEI